MREINIAMGPPVHATGLLRDIQHQTQDILWPNNAWKPVPRKINIIIN
jgi:hypothetical protein